MLLNLLKLKTHEIYPVSNNIIIIMYSSLYMYNYMESAAVVLSSCHGGHGSSFGHFVSAFATVTTL